MFEGICQEVPHILSNITIVQIASGLQMYFFVALFSLSGHKKYFRTYCKRNLLFLFKTQNVLFHQNSTTTVFHNMLVATGQQTPTLSCCVMSLDTRSTHHMCHTDRSSHGTALCAQCDKIIASVPHQPVRSDIDA